MSCPTCAGVWPCKNHMPKPAYNIIYGELMAIWRREKAAQKAAESGDGKVIAV